jgi:hypothetical protein
MRRRVLSPLGNDVLPDIIVGNYQGLMVLRNLEDEGMG